jgi:hypothetical protein
MDDLSQPLSGDSLAKLSSRRNELEASARNDGLRFCGQAVLPV